MYTKKNTLTAFRVGIKSEEDMLYLYPNTKKRMLLSLNDIVTIHKKRYALGR